EWLNRMAPSPIWGPVAPSSPSPVPVAATASGSGAVGEPVVSGPSTGGRPSSGGPEGGGPAGWATATARGSHAENFRHASAQPSSVRANRATGPPDTPRSQMPKKSAPYPSRKRWPEWLNRSAPSPTLISEPADGPRQAGASPVGE